jgi:hypothetical protein
MGTHKPPSPVGTLDSLDPHVTPGTPGTPGTRDPLGSVHWLSSGAGGYERMRYDGTYGRMPYNDRRGRVSMDGTTIGS